MYKLIACDLDETLLDSDHKLSKENHEAIRRAAALGVKFVPATGRGFYSVDNLLKELDLYEKEREYVISYNGGAIVENKGHRLLHFDYIPFETANMLYQNGLNYDVCIHAYTTEMTYVYGYHKKDLEYVTSRMAAEEIEEKDLNFLKGQNIVKVLYMNKDHEYLRKIEQALKPAIEDKIDISFSSNRYIEFNHKGVCKGAGLLKLANIMGIKPEETIAIGDNFNDLSMIRAAGLGVGVQNAVESMKAECDYITRATNDEHAIAEVIQRFIL